MRAWHMFHDQIFLTCSFVNVLFLILFLLNIVFLALSPFNEISSFLSVFFSPFCCIQGFIFHCRDLYIEQYLCG